MKVIELLNKIANGEEVPKFVQYYNMLKGETDIMMVCKENIFYKLDQLEIQLNSRIEPVEEEKKIPEKFKVHSLGDKDENGNFVSSPFPTDEEFMNKINEIIDYLQSKGDE